MRLLVTVDDPHENHDDGHYEKNVYEASDRIGGHDPEKPKNEEYDDDSFEHMRE